MTLTSNNKIQNLEINIRYLGDDKTHTMKTPKMRLRDPKEIEKTELIIKKGK